MVIDTALPNIIRPRPTAEQFARDFSKLKVPDDDIEIARQNTSATKRRVLMRTVPGDGGEAVNTVQQNCNPCSIPGPDSSHETYLTRLPGVNLYRPGNEIFKNKKLIPPSHAMSLKGT